MKKFIGYSIGIVLFLGFMIFLSLKFAENSGENVLSATPQSPGFKHNEMGVEYFREFEMILAKDAFLEAVKADEKLAVAHYNLGLTLHRMDMHPQASEHFAHAIELTPDNTSFTSSAVLKNHLGGY